MLGSVSIQRGRLKDLDELRVDALVLPQYQKYGQPQSVVGYVDWRLSGRIGHLIKAHRFEGKEGETLLMPSEGRIGARRIFVVGLGVAEPDSLQLKAMAKVFEEAGVRDLALAAPCLPQHESSDRHSVRFFSKCLRAFKGSEFEEIILLEAAELILEDTDAIHKAALAGGFRFVDRAASA